jgi:hypothetical protein
MAHPYYTLRVGHFSGQVSIQKMIDQGISARHPLGRRAVAKSGEKVIRNHEGGIQAIQDHIDFIARIDRSRYVHCWNAIIEAYAHPNTRKLRAETRKVRKFDH